MSYDAKDLIRVIKACKATGVSSLKLGDLEVKFGPGEAAQTSGRAGEAVKPPTDNELKEAEEQSREMEAFDRADDELALMQVEDPQLFEELLVQRELERRGDSGESERESEREESLY